MRMQHKRVEHSNVFLKPCPACGDTASLWCDVDCEHFIKVRCDGISCHLETGTFAADGAHGIKLWNEMPRKCPVCLAPTGSHDTSCRYCGRMLPWMKEKCEEKAKED